MTAWLGRALCTLFGHRWGGTDWEHSHRTLWQVRECRRCELVERRISHGP